MSESLEIRSFPQKQDWMAHEYMHAAATVLYPLTNNHPLQWVASQPCFLSVHLVEALVFDFALGTQTVFVVFDSLLSHI